MITYYVVGCVVTILLGWAFVYFDAKSDPDVDWIKNSLIVVLLCGLWPVAIVAIPALFLSWVFDEDTNLTKTVNDVIAFLKEQPRLLADELRRKQITKSSDSIEVINFRDLSGQELDAELTRLHKEKNGWN